MNAEIGTLMHKQRGYFFPVGNEAGGVSKKWLFISSFGVSYQIDSDKIALMQHLAWQDIFVSGLVKNNGQGGLILKPKRVWLKKPQIGTARYGEVRRLPGSYTKRTAAKFRIVSEQAA